jgi:hypothetical protein
LLLLRSAASGLPTSACNTQSNCRTVAGGGKALSRPVGHPLLNFSGSRKHRQKLQESPVPMPGRGYPLLCLAWGLRFHRG